jgi:aspartate racemase
MKILGLIGGTSWVSTLEYYRLINQFTNERLGGSNFARLLLYSVNFNDFKKLVDANAWDEVAKLYSEVARKLEIAGAECIILCANAPHLISDKVQEAVTIPLIHIAEETGKEVQKENIKKVGLLGTKFVMEHPFFIEKLSAFGISTIVPEEEEREFIHASIFTELTKGIFSGTN